MLHLPLLLIVTVTIFAYFAGAERTREKRARYVNEDLPYISCITCDRVAAELHRISGIMKGNAPYKKLTESHIQPLLDGICIPESKYGHWIRAIDIMNGKVGSETILEFGVHYGTSMSTLTSMRGLFEPYNFQREIIGFDTFDGFASIEEEDKNNNIEWTKGDYSTHKDFRLQIK